MVQLTIQVRPQRGYTYSKTEQGQRVVRSVQVDSSLRLEDLLAQLKIDKKGVSLYLRGLELPLNSSLASHNVRNGDILETCSSPLLSAVLSAVISDLEVVQKIRPPELRTRDRVEPSLDHPSLLPADWSVERWSFDHVKRRGICLKMLKQVLQRNGRFANFQVPQCEDLSSLYQFVMEQKVFSQNNPNGFNSMEQCFKPSARNRENRPSLVWELLQHKLDKFVRLAAEASSSEDLVEAFVNAENQRHRNMDSSSSTSETSIVATPTRTTRVAASATSALPQRHQRHLTLHTPSRDVKCTECRTVAAECLCMDNECPFCHKPFCIPCFASNHPILLRQHARIPLTDPRCKPLLRQHHAPPYCPEYASGPFSLLCTLYEQSTRHSRLSLTEGSLKFLAQPRCRANLYDRQARGRSAFACVEKLCQDEYLRKEMIAGLPEAEASKYSLLIKGEALAERCLSFETALESVVRNRSMERDKTRALGGSSRVNNTVSIVIDNREDSTFAQRLVERCKNDQIRYSQRDLPAGDYIFVTGSNQQEEHVLPLVIERKTWSDLADSVSGRGHRRLDCVRVDAATADSCDSKCQLCRMKRTQCARIMFIIEGARCLNRDGQPHKCSAQKRCKYCRELEERHGLVQTDLEDSIYRLVADHHCLVHFTRGYNETITSLFLLQEILTARTSAADTSFSLDLPYGKFCSNARARREFEDMRISTKGVILEWKDKDFIDNIFKGRALETLSLEFGPGENGTSAANNGVVDLSESLEAEEEDSDDDFNGSQESIQVLEGNSWSTAKPKTVIAIDDDDDEDDFDFPESQESVQVIESLSAPSVARVEASPAKRPRSDTSDAVPRPTKRLKQSSREITLLLLSGLYEYDQEYYSDANKIWKSIFLEEHGKERSNFGTLAKERIQQVQESDSPFVERECTMFWVLFLQIHFNVIFHSARQSSCANHLKELWSGSRPARQSMPAASAAISNTPIGSPDEKKCIICFEKLGRSNVQATPCRHCFHRACLQEWWKTNTERRCPKCNYRVGMPKDDGEANRNTQSAVEVAARTTPIARITRSPNRSGALGSDAQVREARLRRFEANGGGRPPRVVPRPVPSSFGLVDDEGSSWACSECTFTNEPTSLLCAMCGQKAATGGKSATPTLSAARDSQARTWNCAVCTLENSLSVRSCNACGTSNPFVAAAVDGVAPTSTIQPGTPTTQQRSSNAPGSVSSTKRVKCGACGGQGHNRASYTAENCPRYYDEAEVQNRRKKKEAEERKKRDAEQRIDQLERTRATGTAQIEQLNRLLAEVQRNQQAQESVTENELKRLQKAKERAEKRARRLG